MNPENRSKYACLVVDNPIWDEAMEEMKKDLFDSFCENVSQQDRERISMAVDMLDDLNVKLNAFLVEGIPMKIVGDD